MLTQGYKLCILDVKYILSLARKHNLTDQLELFLLDYPIASNYFLAQKLPLEINPFTDTFQYTLSTCTPGSYKPASLQLATHCEAERLAISLLVNQHISNWIKFINIYEPTVGLLRYGDHVSSVIKKRGQNFECNIGGN